MTEPKLPRLFTCVFLGQIDRRIGIECITGDKWLFDRTSGRPWKNHTGDISDIRYLDCPSSNTAESPVSALNLDHDEARAIHRVIRAMHDGECPKCHIILPAVEMRCVTGWLCPSCRFSISQFEASDGLGKFAPFMERNLAIFERWRAGSTSDRCPVATVTTEPEGTPSESDHLLVGRLLRAPDRRADMAHAIAAHLAPERAAAAQVAAELTAAKAEIERLKDDHRVAVQGLDIKDAEIERLKDSKSDPMCCTREKQALRDEVERLATRCLSFQDERDALLKERDRLKTNLGRIVRHCEFARDHLADAVKLAEASQITP